MNSSKNKNSFEFYSQQVKSDQKELDQEAEFLKNRGIDVYHDTESNEMSNEELLDLLK